MTDWNINDLVAKDEEIAPLDIARKVPGAVTEVITAEFQRFIWKNIYEGNLKILPNRKLVRVK